MKTCINYNNGKKEEICNMNSIKGKYKCEKYGQCFWFEKQPSQSQ